MIRCMFALILVAAEFGAVAAHSSANFGVTTEMAGSRNQEEAALAAAKITLLALTVQHSGHEPIRRYHIDLGGTPLGPLEEGEATARLAKLAKPLACWSRPEGAMLDVTCRPVSEDKHLQELHSYMISRLEKRQGVVGEMLRRISQTDYDSAAVELKGDSQVLQLTFAALETWVREYLIVGEFGMTTDATLPGDTPIAVMATVRFGPVKQVPVEEVYRVVRGLRDTTS